MKTLVVAIEDAEYQKLMEKRKNLGESRYNFLMQDVTGEIYQVREISGKTRTYDEILAKRDETRKWLANEGKDCLEETKKPMLIKAETLEWVLKIR